MIPKVKDIIKLVLYTLVFIILLGIQTALWPQVFGLIASPLLWLTLVVYLAINRPLFQGVFLAYFLGFIMMSYTAAPLKMIWTPIFCCYLLVYIIRDRFFWQGSGYLAMMTLVASSAYHIVYYILSHFVEKNPTTLLFFDRLTQMVLTPIFAFPLYILYRRIDRIGVEEVYRPETQSEGVEV